MAAPVKRYMWSKDELAGHLVIVNSDDRIVFSKNFNPAKWEDDVVVCIDLDDAIEASLL